MEKHGTSHRSKVNRPRTKRQAIISHTPLVTSGLVVTAIIIGVFFYAQGGLLSPNDLEQKGSTSHELPVNFSDPQTKSVSDVPPEKSLPPTKNDNSNQVQPDSVEGTTATPDDRPTACDTDAKRKAELQKNEALDNENRLHHNKTTKSGLFSLFSMLSRSSARDKERQIQEAQRHQQALTKIETIYRQQLAWAHCE